MKTHSKICPSLSSYKFIILRNSKMQKVVVKLTEVGKLNILRSLSEETGMIVELKILEG